MKFNYHIIILLLLIVRLFTPSTAKASQNYINNLYPSDNDEFETLMEKIRKDFAQNPLIDEFLHKYDTAKGCFTDVDYSSWYAPGVDFVAGRGLTAELLSDAGVRVLTENDLDLLASLKTQEDPAC